MSTEFYNHSRLGRVRVLFRYADMWTVVSENDGELESVVPGALTPIQSHSPQAALPDVIDVQVSVVKARVDINNCTPQQLSDAVDGIGRARASKLVSRRPEGGYRDYAQLESLNPDIGVNWTDIVEQDVIEFGDL